MKKIATLLVFLFGVSLVQGQTCAIRFGMQNRNRNVFGEVGAECPGINNSPPWGNWGGAIRMSEAGGTAISSRALAAGMESCSGIAAPAVNTKLQTVISTTTQTAQSRALLHGSGRRWNSPVPKR